MERYCFHPHALASPQSWLTQLTAGGSSAQMFRLGRLRGSRGGLLGRGDDNAAQASTLVELETGNALGAERNWAWLEEYMAADKLDLVSSSTAGEAGGLTTSYSLTAGTLAFPGPQSPPEDVGSVLSHLASLLSPPLAGSWPLDTAYQWLRNRDPQAPFERRPLWVPGQLPGVASDLEGSMGEGVKRILPSEVQEGDSGEAAAASQREVLRMTYRVQTKDGEDIEPIYRLVVDIEERESEAVAEEAANTAILDAHLDGAAGEPSVSSTSDSHPYTYRIVSAHVTTAREADILAPEHKLDLRLTTRKDRQLTSFELESLATSLQPYLEQMQSSVGESVVKRRTKRMEEEQRRGGSEAAEHSSSPLAPAARKQEAYSSTEELQQDHPRLHEPSVPLHAHHQPQPPMLLEMKGMAPLRAVEAGQKTAELACHFEGIERLYEASWPLKMGSEMEGQPEISVAGARPRLLSTTALSDLTGRPRTTTSVVWSHSSESQHQQGSEEGWRDRVGYVARTLMQAGERR